MEEKKFGIKDKIFAVATVIFSYCLIEFVFTNKLSIISGIIFILITAFIFVYQKLNKIPFTKNSVFLYAVSLILSTSFFFYDLNTVHIFSALFLFILIPLTTYFSFIKTLDYDVTVIFDVLKAIFAHPVLSFGKLFSTIFTGNKNNKLFWRGFWGLLISLPVTSIIVIILIRSDMAFESLFGNIFSDFFDKFLSFIGKFIFTVPISCIFYSLLFSGKMQICKAANCENAKTLTNKLRFIPHVTSLFFALPIILVYVFFFFSQISYFTSGFSGILPQSYTFSEYARQGFYELCIVSFINLFIIIIISVFTKENGKNNIAKFINLSLSFISLGLIAIGLSKMLLYINEFGLTRLRITTIWIMSLLAFIFILLIIKQFNIKFKLIKSATIVFMVLYVILANINMDKIIAKYNIDNYLNGNLKEIDTYLLVSLDDSAFNYILEKEEIHDDIIKDEIFYRKSEFNNYNIMNSNLQEYKLAKTLK